MRNREILEKYSSDLPGVDLNYNDYDNVSLGDLIIMCAEKNFRHPDWGMLAGRLSMLELQESCGSTFTNTTLMCQKQLHPQYVTFVDENTDVLDRMIIEERNFNNDIMAMDTLKQSYLMRKKIKNENTEGKNYSIKPCETPEQMYLRVATYLWYPDIEKIRKVYNSLSERKYIHASPTLFNAGMKRPQLASCFLIHVGDSMDSISKTWNDSALISKECGGIGIDLSSIRHSEIGETGKSRGITPLIKVFERIFYYIDQGGKRKGSCAMYLADWHVDFMTFIEMKKKHIHENLRAKDLFYSAWISDLFMKRVRENKMWSFFCPNKVKRLNETWGDEFEALYLRYEEEGRYEKQLPAKTVMFELIKAQIETGVPYVLYKDAINRKSMQSNIGIIRSSNLCAEIVLHTSEQEIASCNLANVCLNAFVVDKNTYDFEGLGKAVYELVENMNQVIDRTYYPSKIPQIEYANLKNRPVGIGVQGLANVFALMDIEWESQEAKELNEKIFETMYYYAVRSSVDIAKRLQIQYNKEYTDELDALVNAIAVTHDVNIRKQLETRVESMITNGPKKGWYPSFLGSPYSKGLLQFDLWNREELLNVEELSTNTIPTHHSHFSYDYDALRKDMIQYGIRNSTLIALMPTASSAHINGNNECIEPFNNVIGNRTLLSGQFTVVNKHLVQDLEKLGVWNRDMCNRIIDNDGSINGLLFNDKSYPPQLEGQPLKIGRWQHLLRKYKTVYELPQKVILDLSIGRSKYVCQTTSTNCHIARPTVREMYGYHFYAWKNHLKTGMYYLRTNAAAKARNVSTDKEECLACS